LLHVRINTIVNIFRRNFNDIFHNIKRHQTFVNSNYLIGRQPILNRSEQIIGYELLFRSRASRNCADILDASQATAHVIVNSMSSFGLEVILGPHRGFVNLDLELLMSDSIFILPKERVVLELAKDLQNNRPPDLENGCVNILKRP